MPDDVRSRDEADEQHRELGVFGVAVLAVRQPIEHRGELGGDLQIECRESLAELRPAERGDPDLGEQHAAVAVGRHLDEEKVEPAGERALGIEHLQLFAERRAQVFDDLVDGRDQQIFFGHEVVMHEPGRQLRFGGDALHRRVRDTVFQNRGAKTVDDLLPPRAREARPSHR